MDRPSRLKRIGRAKHGSSAGLTLIEIVVAIAVMGIVILAVTPFLKTNLKSYTTVRAGKNTLDMARIGFNRIISEMRRIQGPIEIRNQTAATIEFDGMFSRNDVLETKIIIYTYNQPAGVVTRSENYGGAFTLIENVSSFQIEYLDNNGNAAATYAQIWRLRVSMTVGSGADAVQFIQEIHPKRFGNAI
jgi:prepilin-type N-terminal cleavage/methylation domain-containing protein